MGGRQVVGARRAQHHAVDERQLECGARVGRDLAADSDQLGGAQAQVERIENREMAVEVLGGGGQQRVEHRVGLLPPSVVNRIGGKPDEVLRGQPVRIGQRVVGGRLRAHHQAFGVVGGDEVAPAVCVGIV